MSSREVLSKNSVTSIRLLVPSVAVSEPSTVMTAIYNCFAYEERGRKVIKQVKMNEMTPYVFNTQTPFKN